MQRQLLIQAPEPVLFLPNETFFIKNRINLIFNNHLANINNSRALVLVEKVQEPSNLVFILSGPILLVMIVIILYIPTSLEKREVNRDQIWNHIDNQDLEIILERGRGY